MYLPKENEVERLNEKLKEQESEIQRLNNIIKELDIFIEKEINYYDLDDDVDIINGLCSIQNKLRELLNNVK